MAEKLWLKHLNEAMEKKRDTPMPGARIQWKGTDVCMDVFCDCGADYHIDADFCYFVLCPKCGKTFVCNPDIELIETTYDASDEVLPMTVTATEYDE